MKKAILFLGYCLLGWGTSTLFAQQGTMASGGEATSSGGSISYSIGQIDYNTTTSGTYSIAEGMQQAIEISVVTGIEQTDINLTTSVYPNPTVNKINLTIENTELSNLQYQLFDFLGQVLETKKIDANITSIDMNNMSKGTYLIRVTKNNQNIKTFQIEKN